MVPFLASSCRILLVTSLHECMDSSLARSGRSAIWITSDLRAHFEFQNLNFRMSRLSSLAVHAYSFPERSLEEDNLRVNGNSNCKRLASLLGPGLENRSEAPDSMAMETRRAGHLALFSTDLLTSFQQASPSSLVHSNVFIGLHLLPQPWVV